MMNDVRNKQKGKPLTEEALLAKEKARKATEEMFSQLEAQYTPKQANKKADQIFE
jgi:hypothetical protein